MNYNGLLGLILYCTFTYLKLAFRKENCLQVNNNIMKRHTISCLNFFNILYFIYRKIIKTFKL